LKLVVLPEAEAELLAAAQWYEGKRRGLGIELLAAVDRDINRVLQAPLTFPLWREDRPYRKCVVQRFPYVVFFVARQNLVEVFAVAHAKREPGFWANRPRSYGR
jgi:toxin ParE1/3/4